MSEEYRVQWTGSRAGWPQIFIDMMSGMVLNHTRMRKHAGEDLKLIFAHGDAEGVDKTVGAFATGFGVEQRVWHPDWRANGNRAGIIRNEKMVDEFAPTLGIGLNWNNSRGTDHCVKHMRAKGIPLLTVSYENDPGGEFFPR